MHGLLLSEFGGSSGLRDAGLLDSALGRPKNLAAYGRPGIWELAAAYAFGIVRNHPFVDGNKRTAFLAASVFLDTNGYDLVASEEDAALTMLALASGEMGEAQYAEWLKVNSRLARSPR